MKFGRKGHLDGEDRASFLFSFRSSAEGLLEFIEGKYRFTKIRITPEIMVGREWTREQVEEVVREAHDNCLIANSMTATVEIEPTINLLCSRDIVASSKSQA